MKIKVMVVEDNQSLNKSIINMLKKEKYEAYGALDIESAEDTFLKEKPHIILLDIMLPHGYGYELIKFFRRHNDCRIIMLTALSDHKSKSLCYEEGADDYITKPFDLYELLYKLNAVKRRIFQNLKEISVGDINFSLDTHKLTCRDKSIVIQPSQIRLLKLLYDRYLENSYVDKDEIFEDTCDEINERGRIQTLVARLRKNLLYVESKSINLETIYGKGYRFNVEE
ncbi:MAG: response regulator transcription factor [Bacillota bacterium]|nr:response regulator transcription factor [Bacillota bacterium]